MIGNQRALQWLVVSNNFDSDELSLFPPNRINEVELRRRTTSRIIIGTSLTMPRKDISSIYPDSTSSKKIPKLTQLSLQAPRGGKSAKIQGVSATLLKVAVYIFLRWVSEIEIESWKPWEGKRQGARKKEQIRITKAGRGGESSVQQYFPLSQREEIEQFFNSKQERAGIEG